jgi:hypothetical protein
MAKMSKVLKDILAFVLAVPNGISKILLSLIISEIIG